MSIFHFSGLKRNRTIYNEEPKDKNLEEPNNSQINEMEKKEEKDKLILILIEEKKQVEKQNKMFCETISKLKKEKKILIESNQILNDIIIINEKTIKDLKNKNKELSELVFGCKVRKMLKKLLEYIVNDSDLSQGLIKLENEIYFLIATKKLLSLNYSISDSMGALNKLLSVIFYYSSAYDHKIHFVQKDAIYNKNLRERIPVFEHCKDFFEHFGIDKLYAKILIELIPKDLFKTIDNYSFEQGITSLLSKIK